MPYEQEPIKERDRWQELAELLGLPPEAEQSSPPVHQVRAQETSTYRKEASHIQEDFKAPSPIPVELAERPEENTVMEPGTAERPDEIHEAGVAESMLESERENLPAGESEEPRRARRGRRRGRRRSSRGRKEDEEAKTSAPTQDDDAAAEPGPVAEVEENKTDAGSETAEEDSPSSGRGRRSRQRGRKRRQRTPDEAAEITDGPADEEMTDDLPAEFDARVEVEDHHHQETSAGDDVSEEAATKSEDEDDYDIMDENGGDFSDWDVPSWNDLIASLYRPDR